MNDDFLGCFVKDQFLQNCRGYNLGNFWKHLDYFLPPTSGHTGSIASYALYVDLLL